MRNTIILCMLLVASPIWAGTFIDDFEDGNLDGWAESNPWGATASWSVENGGLVGISTNVVGTDTYFFILDSSDWRDYDISVRVKVAECFSERNCGAGLLVRQGRIY